jgi:dTDP-4-dehydrorhamnose reductase
MNILVVGATGMLGHTVYRVLTETVHWQVYGTVRSHGAERFFLPKFRKNLICGVDIGYEDAILGAFKIARPDVVINCVGLIKQNTSATDPLQAIPLNSIWPHRLALICDIFNSRLVHISTDCVFTGVSGKYGECDHPDARDLYGLSKCLGEVRYKNAITLRTSIIGHELGSKHGLVEWFLSQTEFCYGYTNAVFSGLPTVVLSNVIRDIVIPRKDLTGLYHVSSQPISKFNLLKLIASVYEKTINIIPDDKLVVNRSLNSELFRGVTGYNAPEWPELIKTMMRYK